MTNHTSVSKFLRSADGTQIYADALGDPSKPAVVLIHGFGQSAVSFDTIFEDVEYLEHVYLVRYDTRGHGRSDKPESEDYWQSKRIAEDFDAVVEAFSLVRPFVAGWSMGGMHVADILTFHPPEYLSGIIMITSFPFTASLPVVATPWSAGLIPIALSNPSVTQYQSILTEFVKALISPSAAPFPYYLQQVFLGQMLSQPYGCVVRLLLRTNDHHPILNAGTTGLPLLMINGSDDLIASGAHSARALQTAEYLPGYEGWKDFTVKEFAGVGHMPWYEQPEGFKQELLQFIRRVLS